MDKNWKRVIHDVFKTDLSKEALSFQRAELMVRVKYKDGLSCDYTAGEYLRLREVKRNPTRIYKKCPLDEILGEIVDTEA